MGENEMRVLHLRNLLLAAGKCEQAERERERVKHAPVLSLSVSLSAQGCPAVSIYFVSMVWLETSSQPYFMYPFLVLSIYGSRSLAHCIVLYSLSLFLLTSFSTSNFLERRCNGHRTSFFRAPDSLSMLFLWFCRKLVAPRKQNKPLTRRTKQAGTP